MRSPRCLALVALALLSASCVTNRKLTDPTLLIHSPEGTELGVATEYGAVFLGRFARGGEVDITAWFGDGPSLENSVVEPIGGGLFSAETDLRLPQVPLTYEDPPHNRWVTVQGRSGTDPWLVETQVQRDERVEGLLLRPRGRLNGAAEQIGAGVFLGNEEDGYRLLGLVTGRVRLVDASGTSRDYVTVLGPTELWRLATVRRSLQEKPRWLYREDVL